MFEGIIWEEMFRGGDCQEREVYGRISGENITLRALC